MSSSSWAELFLVPPSDVPDVWPTAKNLLDRAIEMSGGRLTPLAVLDSLLSRDMQLWLAVDDRVLGAMVTQVSTYPSGIRILSVLLVGGGDMRKWLPLWPQVEDWARRVGCKSVEVPRGRKGWTRTLKEWTPMVFMEKEL